MSEEAFYPEVYLMEVGPDILHTKFMTPAFVEYILLLCTELNTWAPNKRDIKYATQDIHFSRELPALQEIIEDQLNKVVWPKVAEWWSIPSFEVSDLFAIRYTLDTQTCLKLHHDDSFITGSVKLNNDYKGAELVFPKKNFSNKNIEVGDLIIWPSNITHLHCSTELLEGEKYSLTIWTRQ